MIIIKQKQNLCQILVTLNQIITKLKILSRDWCFYIIWTLDGTLMVSDIKSFHSSEQHILSVRYWHYQPAAEQLLLYTVWCMQSGTYAWSNLYTMMDLIDHSIQAASGFFLYWCICSFSFEIDYADFVQIYRGSIDRWHPGSWCVNCLGLSSQVLWHYLPRFIINA